MDGLDSSSIIWDWKRYGLEILHHRDKRAKSQKVLGANINVCKSYKGKNGMGESFFLPPF